MLTLGSINLGTVWSCRLAIRPECSLGNSGPDHTPRPPPWPATAVLTTLHSSPPSRNTKPRPLVAVARARTSERASRRRARRTDGIVASRHRRLSGEPPRPERAVTFPLAPASRFQSRGVSPRSRARASMARVRPISRRAAFEPARPTVAQASSLLNHKRVRPRPDLLAPSAKRRIWA